MGHGAKRAKGREGMCGNNTIRQACMGGGKKGMYICCTRYVKYIWWQWWGKCTARLGLFQEGRHSAKGWHVVGK